MYFKNLNVISYNKLSKKDKKNITLSILNTKLNTDLEYTIYKCKDKIELLHNNEMFIAFKKNKWIPTIKYLNSIIKHHNDNKDGIDNNNDDDKQDINKDDKDNKDIIIPFNYILLDAGAYNPLIRGADIMSPGIYKYKHMINIFNKDDILPIIIDNEVVAIGITTVDYSDIKEDSKGQAMINIHSKEDELYKKK